MKKLSKILATLSIPLSLTSSYMEMTKPHLYYCELPSPESLVRDNDTRCIWDINKDGKADAFVIHHTFFSQSFEGITIKRRPFLISYSNNSKTWFESVSYVTKNSRQMTKKERNELSNILREKEFFYE